MKKLVLITLSMLSLCATDKNPKMDFKEEESEEISSAMFTQCKNNLPPPSLKDFVTDFETWSKEDKDKVQIFGLSFMLNGLSKEKQNKYDNNLGLWLDSRTIDSQVKRARLIVCLQYLKQ